MQKQLAELFAKAIYLMADGEFVLTYADKTEGIPHVASLHCEIDTVPRAVVYVANKRKDGGSWLVSLAFKDNAGTASNVPALKRYRYTDEDRRKTSDIYRLTGVADVRVNLTESTVFLRFRTTGGENEGEFHLGLTSDRKYHKGWKVLSDEIDAFLGVDKVKIS